MSFILDSLKKAEQQRQQGQVPGLQSEHAAPAAPPRRSSLIFWVLLVALGINAGLVVWWMVGKKTPVDAGATVDSASRPNQVSVDDVVRSASPPSSVAVDPKSYAASSPVLPEPMAGSAEEARPGDVPGEKGGGDAAPPLSTGPTARPSQPAEREGIPLLSELPAERRQGLPQFTLSLHYYTAEPASRMVRINNRNLRQGESLDGGAELQEITPDGVIINLRGERFRLVNE